MRLFYGLILLGSAFGANACLAQAESGSGVVRDTPIAIREDSNVCVSVHVDQRIWPRPLNDEVARTLSGGLAVELRRRYIATGGSYAVPNSNPAERFVTNPYGQIASCEDRNTDILIDAQYRPRADGTPFIFEYRITQGEVQRQGTYEVNVPEEIQAGRIRDYNERRTNQAIIGEDLLHRAPWFFEQIEPRH